MFNTVSGKDYYAKIDSPSYSVGDTKIFSVTRVENGITNTFNKKHKVIDSYHLFDELITNWEITTNRTNDTINQWLDKDGVFQTIGSGESGAIVEVSKVIKKRTGEFFEKGNIIEDKAFFFSRTAEIGGLPFSGYGNGTIMSLFSDVDVIQTPFGLVDCYKTVRQIRLNSTIGNASVGLIKEEAFEYGTVWLSPVHGIVMSNLSTEREVSDGISSIKTKHTDETLLTFSPFAHQGNTIQAFTNDEISLNQWGGWAWMGSLPWIYNASTGHWGYLANEELYVWDASKSKWLFFNKGKQTWNYAQN